MGMTSRVFVVQEPQRRQRDGSFAAAFDLSPAAAYGDIELLLDTGVQVGIAMQPLIVSFKHKLRGFTDDDYLLPVGDPAAMGIAIAIAANYNSGKVKLLRWDRKQESYIKLQVDLQV